jgi:hypothetical protein
LKPLICEIVGPPRLEDQPHTWTHPIEEMIEIWLGDGTCLKRPLLKDLGPENGVVSRAAFCKAFPVVASLMDMNSLRRNCKPPDKCV